MDSREEVSNFNCDELCDYLYDKVGQDVVLTLREQKSLASISFS